MQQIRNFEVNKDVTKRNFVIINSLNDRCKRGEEILKLPHKANVAVLLEQFKFYKKAHKTTAEYQIWQEGTQPKLIQTDAMMMSKINYIHNNRVKRGYVDENILSLITLPHFCYSRWRYLGSYSLNFLASTLFSLRTWYQ